MYSNKNRTIQPSYKSNQYHSDLFYRSLFEFNPDTVFFLDREGVIAQVNRVFSEKLGYETNDVILQPLETFLPEKDGELYQEVFKQVLKDQFKRIHTKLFHKNGSYIYIWLSLIPAKNDGRVVGVFAQAQDITKEKQADRLNEHLAYHDSLTDLPNRRYFETRLKEEIITCNVKNQKLAVLYLDLDRFKYMNDTMGHTLGDVFLKKISDRLSECIYDKCFLARMGGDEFSILVPNLKNDKEPGEISERIIESLARPFIVDEYELYITTSIGVSVFPSDGEDMDTVLKYADVALYKAKEMGKNTYHIYTTGTNNPTYKRFILENDLRSAVDDNQLELYYQPKVCTEHNEIVGAEALIRWNHPKWGLIPPNEFIPLAEEIGIISKIERWVLYTACKQTKAWQDANFPPIPVSVNLTANRFLEKGFIQTIIKILEETNLEPHFLEIEITESSLLVNENVVFSILDDLRRIGIQISLDDFGTGYSSLSYLKRFKGRIDTLKLDRSFIYDLSYEDSEDDNYITKSIINLAHHLKMAVVAEGVETMEQLQILNQFHCNTIQGYLFSKPVPASEFMKLMSFDQLEAYSGKEEVDSSKLLEQRVYQIDYPILASMTINRMNGSRAEMDSVEVLIDQITDVGLRFISKNRLDHDQISVLKFNTEILGERVKIDGEILWSREVQPGIYHYGVEFQTGEHQPFIPFHLFY
ncbi:sensor domain-containing protein [Oceanobacillus salinisoli]|uniref:sensor domain-containing protein n=1 Tax=Oceanobacillus salinisoli TaxID=2678611 RepID=UPI0012E1F169|nr:EAL domain-containing protein [Oceanobacillus salinisoli]